MRPRALPFATLILAGLCLALPVTGFSQGNGNGNANGNGKPKAPKSDPKPTTPSPSPSPSAPAPSSPAPSPSPTPSTGSTGTPTAAVTPPVELPQAAPDLFSNVTTFRQFGAWLDDASASAAGEGFTSVGMGHWRMQGMTQTNLPMIGMGIGLSDRWQVSASLPFYRTSYDGTVSSGLDDIYLNAKYTVLDPTLTLNEVGLSVGSVVEVLSPGAVGGRMHFAFPVNLEIRRAPYRVYGSAGYFTRGSVFTGGAIEWTSSSRLTLTGSLTQSYSVKSDATLDALGIGARRADVTGSVSYPLGRSAAGYLSVGRSLTPIEEGGTTFSLAGGVAFRFTAPRATP